MRSSRARWKKQKQPGQSAPSSAPLPQHPSGWLQAGHLPALQPKEGWPQDSSEKSAQGHPRKLKGYGFVRFEQSLNSFPEARTILSS